MKPDEFDLLHGYLNGTLSDADFARLQSLLRESVEARWTLRALATVDAKLQELGALNVRTVELLVLPPPPSSRAQRRRRRLAWRTLSVAACVALLVIGALFTSRKPSRSTPDVAAAIASTQDAIAQLSVEPTAALPAWMSPTASLLDQSGFRP